eukprot:GHVU01154098.1.p1 GENE.GHVU01154098.1~~GHVU01154098.1.p1  ORF type:complete len:398 (+),score=39.60 GHVU01154098.1:1215-2408(+)
MHTTHWLLFALCQLLYFVAERSLSTHVSQTFYGNVSHDGISLLQGTKEHGKGFMDRLRRKKKQQLPRKLSAKKKKKKEEEPDASLPPPCHKCQCSVGEAKSGGAGDDEFYACRACKSSLDSCLEGSWNEPYALGWKTLYSTSTIRGNFTDPIDWARAYRLGLECDKFNGEEALRYTVKFGLTAKSRSAKVELNPEFFGEDFNGVRLFHPVVIPHHRSAFALFVSRTVLRKGLNKDDIADVIPIRGGDRNVSPVNIACPTSGKSGRDDTRFCDVTKVRVVVDIGCASGQVKPQTANDASQAFAVITDTLEKIPMEERTQISRHLRKYYVGRLLRSLADSELPANGIKVALERDHNSNRNLNYHQFSLSRKEIASFKKHREDDGETEQERILRIVGLDI